MHERREFANGMGTHHKHLGPRVSMAVSPSENIIHHLAVFDVALPHAVVPRADATSTSTAATSTSCGPDDNSALCQKPVTNSTYTLPIALGIAIPLCGALIAFLYLHRRHVRKQRAEDASDPHKSLDFGLGDVTRNPRAKQGGAQMTRADIDMYEKPTGGERQRSMDFDMVSPYLLPPELQSSRESLHSLARSIQQEDPYRPVTQFVPSDSNSLRSFRPRGDDSSVYTSSSGAPSRLQESSTADLLSNAATMSRSGVTAGFVPPPRQNSLPRASALAGTTRTLNSPLPQIPQGVEPPYPSQPDVQVPPPTNQKKSNSAGLPSNPHPSSDREISTDSTTKDARDSSLAIEGPALRSSHNYLGAFISAQDQSLVMASSPSKSPSHSILGDEGPVSEQLHRKVPSESGWALPANPRPQRKESLLGEQPPQLPQMPELQQGWIDDGTDYHHNQETTSPSPRYEQAQDHRYSMDVPPDEHANSRLGAPDVDPRRISMGFRPLPPEAAVESDDPEIRANRIRSFYKEYFDDSKPPPQGQYYEDYDQNYLGDAAYYDPNSNNFVMPYAQPVTRRAMTPPPKSQRFMGQPPRAFHGSMGVYGLRGMPPPPPPRANSSLSGRMPAPGPRSYSYVSGRLGSPGPITPIPPPTALNTLPTPSKLRDDSFALLNSIEFAPPVSYKERQRGRSQSPLGERRPYSPAVPVFKPLASTYEELPSMPSPHSLQNSGTFTGLDFAPPRRIKDADTTSDAGSIRSNRSGVSAIHQNAIRQGAYRVSRLPGDMIFAKDEMAGALKPTWKVGT